MFDYVDIPPYCISIACINPVSFSGYFLSITASSISKKRLRFPSFIAAIQKKQKKDHNLNGHDPLPIYIVKKVVTI